MELKELTGMKVLGLKINEAKDLLELHTTDKTIYISSVGDCCSKSWFEHINGVDALLNYEIVETEEVEMPSLPRNKEKYEDLTQLYGYKLKTSQGCFDIEMRNESNGYYGGCLKIDEKPLDQYSRVREEENVMKELAEDF